MRPPISQRAPRIPLIIHRPESRHPPLIARRAVQHEHIRQAENIQPRRDFGCVCRRGLDLDLARALADGFRQLEVVGRAAVVEFGRGDAGGEFAHGSGAVFG